MIKEKEYPFHYKMRSKDIAELCYCSIRTADRIKSCIKKTYGVKIVLYKHYLDYFGVKTLDEINSQCMPK